MLENLVVKWVLARGREASTYAGLFGLLAVHFGLTFSPDAQGAITQVLMDLASLAAILISEKGAVTHVAVAPPVEQPVHPVGSMTTDQLNQESARLGQ